MNRRYYYIKANPKQVTGNEYNSLARQYPLEQGNQFVVDWVYDVEGVEIKEVGANQFNMIMHSKYYG